MNVYRKVLAVQSGGRVVDDGFDLVGEIESCIRDAGPFTGFPLIRWPQTIPTSITI